MRQSFREDGLLLQVGTRASKVLRLRVVVSKKVEKRAVRRNRIRRVLKEALRGEPGLMRAERALVLIVLPGFELPRFQETKKRIRTLLQKASLIQ